MRRTSLLAAMALASGTALADVRYVYAPVLDVEPIVETVATVEPRQECWFERAPAYDAYALPIHAPLLGALIGGAVGNAVGHNKRDKQVGAVAGVLIGGSIGHEIGREAYRARGARLVRREVCGVVEDTRSVRRITGYLVTYRYAGHTHRVRMAERPGQRVRVRVSVTPA